MGQRHPRLGLLRSLLFAAACLGLGCAGPPKTEPEALRPVDPVPCASRIPEVEGSPPFTSVVLVTLDTLRADHLGTYGYPRSTSPFLDHLAQEGVRFEQAIATTSHTAPSHASLFTGLPMAGHGLRRNGENLSPSIPNLACFFSSLGYETAGFASVRFLRGLSVGFGAFYERSGGAFHARADQVVGAAEQWLTQTRRTERFLIWVHLFDAHEWSDLEGTPRREMEGPGEEALESHLESQQHLRPGNWGIRNGEPFRVEGVEEMLEWVDSYDARIRFMDDQVRHLYEVVEGLGLPGPTLWVVAGDHGEGLGNHGYHGHSKNLYNEQLRVPLVFHATDGRFRGTVGGVVSLADVYPTLVALMGGAAPDVEGVPLVDQLLGAPGNPDRVVFSERRPPGSRRVREAGWIAEEVLTAQTQGLKYLMRSRSGDQLFDLEADPGELKNLIGDGMPGEPLRQRLLPRLDALQATPEEPAIEEDVREELEALGYLP